VGDAKRFVPRRFQRSSATGGFTLLELMIVLFLAMLMMGMGVIAMMNRLPAARLDAAAREISALMRQARTLARIHMVKQALVVDLDAGHYGIEGKSSLKIPEGVRLKIDDPLTGDVDKGIYRLVFLPFGGIEGGAIRLTTDKRSITITPDPVMGFLIDRKKRD
jgi:general secretion pathway protein H